MPFLTLESMTNDLMIFAILSGLWEADYSWDLPTETEQDRVF